MPSVTGRQLITGALGILGIYAPGEAPSAADETTGLAFLNDLLDEWSNRQAFIPFIARERFDLQTDKGGPDTRYTVGPGGDWDTTPRPANQATIVGANLILTATSPEVRVPLLILSDQAYDGNSVPSLTSTQPIALYYNPTYTSDFGSAFLWPVVNNATNDIELFLRKPVAQFANVTTQYDVPTGLPRAIQYQLALAVQSFYGVEMTPVAMQSAVSSLAAWKRGNLHLSTLRNDASGIGAGGIYDILSDTVRGR